MKCFIPIVLLTMGTVQAEDQDQVSIRYQPGMRPSGMTVVVTINQSFDKRGKLVPEVFQRLEAIQKLPKKSFVVPDATYITIGAEHNGKRLESSSCHTLFESNDKLVARATGVTSLKGRSREEVLSEGPEEFLEFRRLWEEAFSMSMKTVNETMLSRGAEQYLKDCQTIKPGMTRAEVEERFPMDGGLQAMSPVRLAHPQCPCVKVDVSFATQRDPEDQNRVVSSPDDKVTVVSKPYLETPFFD